MIDLPVSYARNVKLLIEFSVSFLPVIVSWGVIYMQSNKIAKFRLQQQAIRIQNNSKSFRRNILINVKLESQCDEI